jgi:hypothetical protein
MEICKMTRIFRDETSALRRRKELQPSYAGKALVVLHRTFGDEHRFIIAEKRVRRGKIEYVMGSFA